MTIICPNCHTACEGSPDLVGTEVRCPNCRHEFIAGNLTEPPTRLMVGQNTPPACVKTAGRLIILNLIMAFAFQILFLMSGLFEGYGLAYIASSGIWFVLKILVFGIALFVVRRILAGSSLARSVLNVVGLIAIVGSLPELGRLFHPTSGILVLGAIVGLVTSLLLLVAIVLMNQSEANDWFRTMKERRKHSSNRSPESMLSAQSRQQGQDGVIVESNNSIGKTGTSIAGMKLAFHKPQFYEIIGIVSVVSLFCLFAISDPFSLFETKPGDIRTISVNGTKFRFAWCPPGTFMMGSPDYESGRFDNEVRHQVTLTSGFWVGVTEVTQNQWESLMNGETLPEVFDKAIHDRCQYDFRDGKRTYCEQMGWDYDSDLSRYVRALGNDVPIHYVGWKEASRFCSLLTEYERSVGRLPDGFEYRLPTEAEWEYACRAGTSSALPNGRELFILGKNNAPELDRIAWYGGNSSNNYYGFGWNTENWPEKQYPGGIAAPRIVAQNEPNNWGIYDMIGNVAEWTNDRYSMYSPNSVTNPIGHGVGEYRVVRGGAWNSFPSSCRSAFRTSENIGMRDSDIGFRIVLAPRLTQ